MTAAVVVANACHVALCGAGLWWVGKRVRENRLRLDDLRVKTWIEDAAQCFEMRESVCVDDPPPPSATAAWTEALLPRPRRPTRGGPRRGGSEVVRGESFAVGNQRWGIVGTGQWSGQSIRRSLALTRRAVHLAVLLTAWLAANLAFSIPTALSAVMDSLPENNTLGLSGLSVGLLARLLSPFLVLVSEVVIPRMSRLVARRYQAACSPGCDRKQVALELMLSSRLLLLVGLPIAAEIALSDSCYQGSRLFWKPCNDGAARFDLNLTMVQEIVTPIEGGRFFRVEVNHDIPALRSAEVRAVGELQNLFIF